MQREKNCWKAEAEEKGNGLRKEEEKNHISLGILSLAASSPPMNGQQIALRYHIPAERSGRRKQLQVFLIGQKFLWNNSCWNPDVLQNQSPWKAVSPLREIRVWRKTVINLKGRGGCHRKGRGNATLRNSTYSSPRKLCSAPATH